MSSREKVKSTSVFTKSLIRMGFGPMTSASQMPIGPSLILCPSPPPSQRPEPSLHLTIMLCEHRFGHLPASLRTLPWLPISICMWSRILSLVYNALCSTAPAYFSRIFHFTSFRLFRSTPSPSEEYYCGSVNQYTHFVGKKMFGSVW